MIELLGVTILWGAAVVLYYRAGKSIGYKDGFCDGIAQGQKNVIDFMNDYQEWK